MKLFATLGTIGLGLFSQLGSHVESNEGSTKPVRDAILLSNVRWHRSFEGASHDATRDRKLVLHFQLLGDFADEFC